MEITDIKSRIRLFSRHDTNETIATVDDIARLLLETFRSGNSVFAAGNGGSASEASHFIAELVGRFIPGNREALRAISLNADTSVITAISNDFEFENVFSRQLEGLAKSGDLVFAFSTSGSSPNILRVMDTAKQIGSKIVLFTGKLANGKRMDVDIHFEVNSSVTALIQEVHLSVIHMICENLEYLMRENNYMRDSNNFTKIEDLLVSKEIQDRLVWVNGCFDILHAGHLQFLRKASCFGDRLWVGVNSDLSIKQIKGDKRPIQNEAERVGQLLELPWVDKVILFDDPDPTMSIAKVKPGIVVKSSEYRNMVIPESQIIKELGSQIIYIDRQLDLSTSRLVSRILASQ